MSFERTRPWFRVLAVLLATSFGLLLPAEGVLSAFAQESPQQLFDAGVAAYKLVELEKAEQHLLRAAELLKPREPSDPEARRLGAQVHLYLGRVTLVADKPERARDHFLRALELDPSLVMVTEMDPPRIVQAFEAARVELAAAQPAPEPARVAPTPAAVAVTEPAPPAKPKRKKRWIWWAIGGAAVAAAGIVALGAGSGGGEEDVMLQGNWGASKTLGTNTCGNEEYSIFFNGSLRLTQSGSSVNISSNEGLVGSLDGSVDGRRLSFSGMVQSSDGECNTTEAYRDGAGDAVPDASRVNGTFTVDLTRISVGGPASTSKNRQALRPPCDFQCTYEYSFVMAR